MTTSCTDSDHPYYKELNRIDFEERRGFFLENDGKRMKFVSLGECLDFVSAGSRMHVHYDVPVSGLVGFVKSWMDVQIPKVEYNYIKESEGVHRVEKKSKEYGYLWNRFDSRYEEKLPRINKSSCDRCVDGGVIMDMAGRDRCSGVLPSTWDREDGEVCYNVIREPKNFYLPLENVFSRLTGPLASDRLNAYFPFSGFSLANYVAAWHGQKGEKQFFKKDRKLDVQKVHFDSKYLVA